MPFDEGPSRKINEHWRRPADGDAEAWIKELRARSHDFANWAGRVEGMLTKLSTADEIADVVEKRLRRSVLTQIGRAPKLIAAAILVMQAILMARGF